MSTLKVSPKDFFFWLGAIIGVYGSVGALIALLFQYITYAFPDPLAYYVEPYSGGMRFAMATLIVLVPVTLLLMRFIRKDIAATPEKSDLWVRRWALVLTVFVAGIIVVVDLITLINYFLGGDLTTPFLLKVAVVFLVAGAVFLHFVADLRGYWTKNPGQAQMVGYAAAALITLSILAGFFIMGSPSQVRLYRFDDQKVSDLQTIQWQIVNFWQQKERLPLDLSEVADPLSGYSNPLDPQTGAPYTYETTGQLSFKLCAEFNAESQSDAQGRTYPKTAELAEDNWHHDAGEECFERTVDPERYPPFSKQRSLIIEEPLRP